MKKKFLFSLLLVVFIDSMGQGLLFPILNTLIMDPSKGILPSSTSINTRQFYYGLLIGCFFLSWFIGATYIAKTSDIIGRKKALLICLYGAFAGYALTIPAFYLNNLWLILTGRIIAGLTAGSQAVAQASMIDVSNKKDKVRNLGLVLVAFAIGMVGGPFIGGFFSDNAIFSWFNLATPFYVVLIIIIVNIVFIQAYFHDNIKCSGKFVFKVSDSIAPFIAAFKDKTIRKLSIVFFLMQISFNGFYVFLSVFLYDKYQYTTLKNSIFLAVFGGAFALSSGLLAGPISKRFDSFKTIKTCLVGQGIFQLCFIFFNNQFLPFILITGIGIMFGVGYILMLSLFSACVDESQQGWIMGITISIFTLGTGIISLAGGSLLNLNVNFLYALTGSGMFVSAIFIHVFYKKKLNNST